ncbi:MAG: hypothetical protein ACRD0K_25590 [Egibacteraceae bacterium]
MSARSEYDAAYFTLLRAQEERDHLLRYWEFLEAERDRLDDFAQVTHNATDALPRALRRTVDATTKSLLEAIGRRRAAVLHELSRMDDRLTSAEAFVLECEGEVQSLRI